MKIIKTVLLFIALTTISLYSQAQKNINKINNQKPTIIFVHGLWADGSCWNNVIATLQAEGYKVVSAQNPTTSLVDDVDAVKKALDRTEGPVILVGHSWGGFVITEAGTDKRVVGLIYVAGFAPDANETAVDLLSKAAPNDLGKYFQVNNGFITLTQTGIKKAFAADLTEKQQLQLYATQTPAAQSVFGAKNSVPAWKEKSSWYIVAKNDQAINPDLERLMAKRINAVTVETLSSHVVMLAQPNVVVKIIKEAAAKKY